MPHIPEDYPIQSALTTAERIENSVLWGDARGFGYKSPTGKEYFEQQREKELADEANAMCQPND